MKCSKDFSAYSLDEHGVRYKCSLTHEAETCLQLQQRMQVTIEDVEWQFPVSEDTKLVGRCNDADTYEQMRRKKLYDLNGRRLSANIDNAIGEFCIRQSAVVSYAIMRPEVTAIFGEFAIKGANRKCAMRALIPLSANVREVPFFHSFASHWSAQSGWMCISVAIDDTDYVFNGIRFKDGGIKFLVYEHMPHGRRHYLVIETLDAISYDVFKMRVLKVISAIGFITGLYHYGPMYVFNSVTHRMIAYNGCVQDAQSARYKMFSLNPYEYYSDEDLRPDIGKTLEPSLKPVTMPQFETLLSHLEDNAFCDLYYAYENVLTRMSTAPVITRLVIYSACLEMARRWAVTLHKQKAKELECENGGSNALLTKKVRKEINHSIEKILRMHGSNLLESDIRIVKKRMGGLYSQANADQLIFAFNYFGVGLSKHDCDVLAKRNHILHGENVIRSKFDPKHPSGRYMDECEQLCFDFHVLIWRLIMVSIGYDGKYRNVAMLDKMFRKHRKNGGKPLARSVKGRGRRK